MPGPPPRPDAIRRNARPDFIKLPAEGRKGRTPPWPLGDPNPTAPTEEAVAAAIVRKKHEREVWTSLWRTPQAVMWERMRSHRTVARYVRVLVLAEMYADKDELSESRLLEVQLGITPAAMKSLMWMIVEDEVGAQRGGVPTSGGQADGKAAKARRLGLAG